MTDQITDQITDAEDEAWLAERLARKAFRRSGHGWSHVRPDKRDYTVRTPKGRGL